MAKVRLFFYNTASITSFLSDNMKYYTQREDALHCASSLLYIKLLHEVAIVMCKITSLDSA